MSKFIPSFSDYTISALETISRSELRKEYTRMRDVAQKRVQRLQKEFPGSKASQKVVNLYDNKGELKESYSGFRKLKDLRDEDIAKGLSEMAKFVLAQTSTVTGQRRKQAKTISTLNKAIGAGTNGQAGVTKENYWRVIKILEEARRQKIVYGSDKIVTLAESTMGLSQDQFDEIMDNLSKALENADDFSGSLEDYMDSKGINDYQIVDMSDFIKDTGW